METAAKCTGTNFSITGDDGAECFEVVESFKYLGRVHIIWTMTGWRCYVISGGRDKFGGV